MTLTLTAAAESWPLEGSFTISRGTRTKADVIVATLTDGTYTGRGECTPYPRYNESMESVMDEIMSLAPKVAAGLTREGLQDAIHAGAARNALDCAFWDLEAKRAGKSVAEFIGITPLKPVLSVYTISLGTPEVMAEAAAKAASRPMLKVKLGGVGDDERIAAVRKAAPNARLIVDANEAWTGDCFDINMKACQAAGVELVEQPLPSADDALLADVAHPILVCADESVHTRADLPKLKGKYDAINIKLDKAGGLTEGLELAKAAKADGFTVMTGCMLGTSLAMAPASLVAQTASFVDLDGPLLLKKDRDHGLVFEGNTLYPPKSELWG